MSILPTLIHFLKFYIYIKFQKYINDLFKGNLLTEIIKLVFCFTKLFILLNTNQFFIL